MSNGCIKGIYRKANTYVSDWQSNQNYLFYAISIAPKRSRAHLTPEHSCRMDNTFYFESRGYNYQIDTKAVSEIRIRIRYKGILKVGLNKMTDMFNKMQNRKNNKELICDELKNIYLSKKHSIKRSVLVWGFLGYIVYEWYLKDGQTGYAKMSGDSNVETIYDLQSFYKSIGFFLFLATMFFLLFGIFCWGSLSNIFIIF